MSYKNRKLVYDNLMKTSPERISEALKKEFGKPEQPPPPPPIKKKVKKYGV